MIRRKTLKQGWQWDLAALWWSVLGLSFSNKHLSPNPKPSDFIIVERRGGEPSKMFIIGVGRRLLLSIYIHNKILSSNLVLLVVTFRLETTVSFRPLWAAHQPREHNNLNSALSLSPVTIFIIDNHFIFNISLSLSLSLYVSLIISLGWMFAISETLTDIYHSGVVEVVR